ncbi:PH domain-containing protein [Kitasatospora purpeofusca]|uniref:PH domain-containing protein n=1 Tax=Kitasatospora purpeofusca TaxID=67352 RepID=UPI0036D2E9B4
MTDKALPPSTPVSVRPNPLLGLPLMAGGLLISLPKALDGGPTAPGYAVAAVVSALAPAVVLLLSVTVGRERITVRRGLRRTSLPLAELHSVAAEESGDRGPHVLLLEGGDGTRCRIPLPAVRQRDRQRLVAALERTTPPGVVREDRALRHLLGLSG